MSESTVRPILHYDAGDQPVAGYKLLRELGRGAMGVVWLAVTENGFERAFKVIDLQHSGGRKEFRGLRVVKNRKILHGNLLTLIDYWLKDAEGRFVADSADSATMIESQLLDSTPPGSRSAAGSTAVGMEDTKNTGPILGRMGGTLVPEFNPAAADLPREILKPAAAKAVARPVQLLVAMELGHKTLFDRLEECQKRNEKGIPVEELLQYMEQAARGLDYLHRHEIVHRDIKPQNIMLVGDVAKVCDYGLVTETDTDLRSTSLAFSPYYASPEAVTRSPLTGRADQYSLAVTYVELRCAKLPYARDTEPAVYAAKETGEYDLSMIRKGAVRAVLKKALSNRPADRYANCAQFVQALKAAEHSRPLLKLAARISVLLLAVFIAAFAGAMSIESVRNRLLSVLRPETPLPIELIEELGQYQVAFSQARTFDKAVAKPKGVKTPLGDLVIALNQHKSHKSALAAYHDAELLMCRQAVGAKDWDQLQNRLTRLRDAALNNDQALVRDYLDVAYAGRSGASPGSDSRIGEVLRRMGGQEAELDEILGDWEFDGYRLAAERLREPRRYKLLADARAARIAGDEAGAARLLNDLDTDVQSDSKASSGLRVEAELERVHLDFSRLGTSATLDRATSDDWLHKVDQAGGNTKSPQAAALRLLVQSAVPGFPDLDSEQLAHDFGALAMLTKGWVQFQECRLSPSESQRLDGAKAELKERVVAYDKRLTSAWTSSLAEVFPANDLTAILLLRTRQFTQSSNGIGLKSAVEDLEELAGLSGAGSAPKLDPSTSAEVASGCLEARFKLLGLAEFDGAMLFRRFAELAMLSGEPAKWLDAGLNLAIDGKVAADAATGELTRLAEKCLTDSAERKQFDDRLASLVLTPYLTDQKNLSDKTHQTELLALLKSFSADLSLPALLRLEVSLLARDAAGQVDAEELRKISDGLVAGLSGPQQSAEQLRYARFLRVWLDPQRAESLTKQDLQVLLDWPEMPVTEGPQSWQSARRRTVAVGLLTNLAKAGITLGDEAILQFSTPLPADRLISSSAAYLEKAARLGADSPLTRGLLAIVRARGGNAAQKDWQRIGDDAAAALRDSAVAAELEQRKQKDLVQYISALAAVEHAKSSDVAPPVDALRSFDAILARHFAENVGRRDSDEGLFRNVILPALSAKPWQDLQEPDRLAMARLLGAKARLLERNADRLTFVALLPALEGETDPFVGALEEAHRAYVSARQFAPAEVTYAAGAGRTLLELPPSEFDPAKAAAEIAPILNELPKELEHIGILQLRAWAKEQESQSQTDYKQQVRLIKEALALYEKLIGKLKDDDPYQIKDWTLIATSNAHVHAAFLTPVASSDEDTAPPEKWTKRWHLELAEAGAKEAQANEQRQLPDWAFICAGNAQEDLAHYLKITQKYQASCESFASASEAARSRRAKAYALFYLGRCQFRWAEDQLAVFGSASERAEKLAEASETLQQALDKWGDAATANSAETQFWMAHANWAQARANPGQKLALMLKARDHFRAAIELAEKCQSPDLGMLVQDSALLDLFLIPVVGPAGAMGLTGPELRSDAKAKALRLLNHGKDDPATAVPANLVLALRILRDASAGDLAILEPWLKFLGDNRAMSDDWKSAYASALLMKTEGYLTKAQPPADEAQLLADAKAACAAIADPLQRGKAAARYSAMAGNLAFNRRIQPYVRMGKSSQVNVADLVAVRDLYAQATSEIIGAYDGNTQARLKELGTKSLTEIPGFKSALRPLERDQVEKAIREMKEFHQNLLLVLELELRKRDVEIYEPQPKPLLKESDPAARELWKSARQLRQALQFAVFYGSASNDQQTLLLTLQKLLSNS